MDIEQLIDNGDTDELKKIVVRYFNSNFESFLKHLTDEGLLEEADEVNYTLYELFPKEVISFWISKDSKKIIDYIIKTHFNFVSYENGKYYMEIDNLSDLHFLFRGDSANFAKSILLQEFDPQFYSINDLGQTLSSLITELNQNSQDKLANYCQKYLSQYIDYNGDDETITSYVDMDKNEDTFLLTKERLDEILSDEDILSDLLENSTDFEDLGSTIKNAYSDAYSNVESDAYYNKTINELKGFFETEDLGYYDTRPVKVFKSGVETTKSKEIYKVNISNIILNVIKEVVDDRMGSGNDYNPFYDFGNFEDLLREFNGEEIRVYYDRINMDYTHLDNLFNEYFVDNI